MAGRAESESHSAALEFEPCRGSAADGRAAHRQFASTSLAAVRPRRPGFGRTDRRRRPRDRSASQRGRGCAGDRRHPDEPRERIAAVAEFVRKRMIGDYTVDEFGFDQHLNDAIFLPLLRVLFNSWFRVEVSGIENLPETGAALVVANHAGVLPFDGLMASVAVHDNHPGTPRPAAAGRRHGVRPADDRPGRAQGRPHHGVHRRRAPAAGRRRAHRGLPRGLQGPGQALQGPLQAAALRSGWIRLGRAADQGARSCRARSSAPRRSIR